MCLSVSHPGSRTFLFFTPRFNASVTRQPDGIYADPFFYFQLKIVAPPINVAPLRFFFWFWSELKRWRMGFMCLSPEGGCDSYLLAISVITFFLQRNLSVHQVTVLTAGFGFGGYSLKRRFWKSLKSIQVLVYVLHPSIDYLYRLILLRGMGEELPRANPSLSLLIAKNINQRKDIVMKGNADI